MVEAAGDIHNKNKITNKQQTTPWHNTMATITHLDLRLELFYGKQQTSGRNFHQIALHPYSS
jgi:hypothetical protein